MRQRINHPHSVAPVKIRSLTPVDRESELWSRFYRAAVVYGHDDPEKMADSSVRARERANSLAEARPSVKLVLAPPKPNETVVNEKLQRKGRALPHDTFRCKALTLEGRRCGFKSVCGDFCKKHSIDV